MKFTKTLASVCAAAIAVSSLAVSAFAGSITFSDKVWWTQKDLKIEDILEGNKPEDVESITFTGDTAFLIGYNSTTVTDETKGSTWKSSATPADTFTVTDAVLTAQEIGGNTIFPAFSVMLSKADGVDYTINWKVNLKNNDPAAPKPVQTKADISFTDGKTPSYTYTVKGDIDTLKVDVALSADAAAAGSGWNDYCSAGVAVKNPDGTVKYYQWGGASIAWAWDVNGDGVGDTKDGVGTETWVGTVGADGGQLSIPVVKGAVVDFYCLSWDKYKGVQYTFTINDEEAAVKPVEPVDPVDPVDPPVDPGKTEDPAEPVAPADVKIANSGRTVIDSGLVRTNIINEWTGNDADVIADKAAFAGANKISVKFTVTNFTTPFKAWIAMADSKWECQFQGEGDKRNANAKCTPVEVTGNGTYVVTIDLDKVIDGVAFISVCTDLKAADGDAIPTIAIDQIKINEEITVKPGEPADPTKPGDTEDPTKPGESDPAKPGESDPVKPGESDPVKPGDCSGEPVNPPTGAAVAVIPAALAAAAVATTGIVLKKRSK